LIAKSENHPTDFSKKNIDGRYQNKIDESTRRGLWNILAENISFARDTTKVFDNSSVQFELVDEKTLNINLLLNDSVAKSMELSGKIKNGYFSIKSKFLLIPIPALLFYRERKTIIGNDTNGNLILTRGYKNGAWFLVIASDFGGISSFEFERIITNRI
jgi:hypothetical protein